MPTDAPRSSVAVLRPRNGVHRNHRPTLVPAGGGAVTVSRDDVRGTRRATPSGLLTAAQELGHDALVLSSVCFAANRLMKSRRWGGGTSACAQELICLNRLRCKYFEPFALFSEG